MTQGRRGGPRGGGGEADKRQKRAPPDAATIALLRAEATTHGAPATLPDQYLSTWLKYAKARGHESDADTVDLLEALKQQHEGNAEEDEDGGGGDGDLFCSCGWLLMRSWQRLRGTM